MRSPVPGDHCCLPQVEFVELFSTCVASCITKVRIHPSWSIRGALGTFILADAALNIVHLDTACVMQGYFLETSQFFGTKVQNPFKIIHQWGMEQKVAPKLAFSIFLEVAAP